MTDPNKTINRKRILFLDNLRTLMIFLVVLLHCGLVYEQSGIGALFWIVDQDTDSDFYGAIDEVYRREAPTLRIPSDRSRLSG